MKNIGKHFLAYLLAVSMVLMGIPESMAVMKVHAENVTSGTIGENLTWEYSSDGTLTIGGKGSMPDYTTVSNYYTGITTDVPWKDYLNDITRVVVGKNVINIGKCAFSDCPVLKQVSLPSGIEGIGESAFARCVGLESIVLPNHLKTIGNSAFVGCDGITKIEIPDSVVSIGSGAFQACRNLETVILSKNLPALEFSVFSSCSKLVNIEIPQSVTRIGAYAFAFCTALSEMDIPISVGTVFDEAFMECSTLRKVTVHNASLSYYQKVFENCPSAFVLYGKSGSTSEAYAKENGYTFIALNPDEEPGEDPDENPGESSSTTVIPGKVTYYGLAQKELSEKELVKEAADEFVKAENEYISAMNSAIRLGVNSMAEVEAIKEKDQAGKQHILTLDANAPDTAVNAAYAGVAEFFREYRDTTPSIGEINISASLTSIEAKISKAIKTSIQMVNVQTKYERYTVKIKGIFEWGAFACEIKVSGNGRLYTGAVTSTMDGTAKVMAAYIKALGEAGESVSKQALKNYLKNFAKCTCIADFTSDTITAALTDTAGYLQAKDWGKRVLEYGVKLYDGYELVESIVKSRNETGLNNSLSNAEDIYKKIKAMSYTDSSVKDKTVKNTIKEIEKARKNLEETLWNYIYHSKSESGTLSFLDKVKGTYKKIVGHCPVNFVVYDEAGKVLGTAEDGYCEYGDSIYIEVSDDVKTIYVPNDMKIRIELMGTDIGTMSYMVEQYKDNIPSGRMNYYDIPLADGNTYSQVIPSGDMSAVLNENNLNAADGSSIKPDEHISVEDSAQVNLSCAVSGQGNVSGAGLYVKGDAAEFAACPDDGYYFAGWYDGENLVGVETTYRLAALADKELKAVFQKVAKAKQTINCEESYAVSVADGGFSIDAFAGGSEIHYFSTDKNVVDVDSTGMVSIIGPGTAQIVVLAAETEDYNEAVRKINVVVSERQNSGEEEKAESKFELAKYTNLVRNHIPEPMGKCRTSFLGKGADGGYQVAVYDQGKIYVRNFSSTYQLKSSQELDLELSIWGGIYFGKSYNYVICGEKRNTEKSHGGEVYRIIKYSKEFERIGSISLNSEETYTATPFTGGNVSVDESGNVLTVYTSRLRLDGHQSNIIIHINTSDMTLADKDGIADFPTNHVSHSLRQIVEYDDNEPVYVDVSDGYPKRSFCLQSKDVKKALVDIDGEDDDNVTNAELSGLAVSDTNYLVVGSYINQGSNNIFLSSMDKKSGEVDNQWLTNSSVFAPKYFHNPRIVKLTKDKFVVMWGSYTTQYILVDGKGKIISELKESSAPITDCEPIYDNGKVLCLSVENGLMSFYGISDFSSNGIYKPEIETVKSGPSWDGTADISWYAAGKKEFDISTAKQLAGLAELVNNGNTFQGKKINLCQDIFLNDETYQYVWTPIAAYIRNDASNKNVFQGTFCGNGHTIYNMRTAYDNNGGLFGRIGENGSVKCVDISQGLLNSGGCIANVNEGIISFCNNYSRTGGEDLYAVGGICNFNSNLVYGCKNFGEVWGSCPAGIVGLNKEGMSVVSQCSNHALVGGNGDVAGIVYLNWGWLYNCYNKGIIADAYLGMGNMYDRARSLAGIVHENNDYGIVENCYFAGIFSYQADAPWMGVCGICRQNNGREVTNCYSLSARGQNDRKTVSYEEMADPSFVQKLDQQKHSVLSVWKADVNKINDGLPITVADESAFTGQCKIQPEAWILGGNKVIEANLEDGKYQLEFSCYYNDAPPIVTVGDKNIAEISEDNIILFKKAGTTSINVHFNETENNSSADYQLTLKINGRAESLAHAEVSLSPNSYIYDGKAKTPSVTVKLSGKTLVMNTDYTVS